MLTLLIVLLSVTVGFTLGRLQPKKTKTPQQITTGILQIFRELEGTPIEYRELCDKLELPTKEELECAFQEIMDLATEGTIVVSEEPRLRRVYKKL